MHQRILAGVNPTCNHCQHLGLSVTSGAPHQCFSGASKKACGGAISPDTLHFVTPESEAKVRGYYRQQFAASERSKEHGDDHQKPCTGPALTAQRSMQERKQLPMQSGHQRANLGNQHGQQFTTGFNDKSSNKYMPGGAVKNDPIIAGGYPVYPDQMAAHDASQSNQFGGFPASYPFGISPCDPRAVYGFSGGIHHPFGGALSGGPPYAGGYPAPFGRMTAYSQGYNNISHGSLGNLTIGFGDDIPNGFSSSLRRISDATLEPPASAGDSRGIPQPRKSGTVLDGGSGASHTVSGAILNDSRPKDVGLMASPAVRPNDMHGEASDTMRQRIAMPPVVELLPASSSPRIASNGV